MVANNLGRVIKCVREDNLCDYCKIFLNMTEEIKGKRVLKEKYR